MNKYERFACDWYLSVYPHDLTYDEVMVRIIKTQGQEEYDDEFLINDTVEWESASDIIDTINDLRLALEDTFK
jgi:hypothetical protein